MATTTGRAARLAAAVVALASIACAAADDFPWLDALDAGSGVKESGERLIALPHGLHALEPDSESAALVSVAVHGWASRGYEWVYPMQTLNVSDDENTAMWFYRWNDKGCPGPAAAALIKLLGEARFAGKRLRLIGHSYGGVLVAMAAQLWATAEPLEVHAVAAPLAGVGSRCSYETPNALPPGVAWFEWRTRHELDGAFRAMPVDPQAVKIAGAKVTRLPETYRGRRLGHNWSISWVADTLAGRTPEP